MPIAFEFLVAGCYPEEKMALRSQLRALVGELRHAHTRLLPIEVAERVQHTIVRIETLLAAPTLDVGAADEAVIEAHRLLDDCSAHLPKS